jgi:hypothetical protein
MKESLLIEELVRIREMMGFNGYNKKLLLEIGRQLADEALPGGVMDDLAALGKTVDDIFTYSTKLGNDFPTKTFDSIVDRVAQENGNISSNSVTKEMMQEFFAKSGTFDDLAEVAAKIADEKVGGYISDTGFMNAFRNANLETLPSTLQVSLKNKVTAANKGTMNQILDGYKNLIEGNATLKNSDPGIKILDTINNKKKEIADFDANEVRKTQNQFTPPPPITPLNNPFPFDVDSKILEDMISIKERYPDLTAAQLKDVRDQIMARWGTISDEATYRRNADQLRREIEAEMKRLQDEINREKDSVKKQELEEKLYDVKKKSKVLENVKKFCLGNWAGWKSAGPIAKSKLVGNAFAGFSVCVATLALLVGEGVSWTNYFYYDRDGQFKNTLMCPLISGVPLLGTWMCKEDEKGGEGWFSKACPDTCAAEREAEEDEKNPEPNPEPKPNPNSNCLSTLADMKKELDDAAIKYKNEKFDVAECTGSYDETITDANGIEKTVTQTWTGKKK